MKDPESGLLRRLALTRRTRHRYTAAMEERRQRLTDAFYGAGMDHTFLMYRPLAEEAADLEASPGISTVLEPLMELFSARRRAS